MQRWAVVLIALGLAAGLIVGGQRFILEQDFTTVEMAVDLADLMAQEGTQDLSKILTGLDTWGADSLVITLPTTQQWKPDELRKMAQAIRSAGCRVILRVGGDEEAAEQQGLELGGRPEPADGTFSVNELAAWISLIQPQVVMFGGACIAVSPEDLVLLASLLRGTGTRFGLQEFAHQVGEAELARLAPTHVVRVHTIYPRELPRYEVQSAQTRFLRAVRERSYRLLYVRFWPGMLPTNRELLSELAASLQAAGYTRGPAASLPSWQAGRGYFAMAILGWLGAGLMLCSCLGGHAPSRWKRWSCWCLTGVAVALFALYLFYDQLLAGQALAFLAAITFPTLAAIPQRWAPAELTSSTNAFSTKGLSPVCTGRWQAIGQSLRQFGRAVGITLAGAAVVVTALGDYRFMLKIAQFRGVKAMSLLPLVIVGYAAIAHFLSLGRPLKLRRRWQAMSAAARTLSVIGALAVIVIYIGRTGNFVIPVPALELRLREALEELFLFRPRTKEFVIGHPLLILGLGLYGWGWHNAGLLGVVFGTIGQISLLNTFAHIHSPLQACLSRSAWGLSLGAIIGCCLLSAALLLLDRHIGGRAEAGDQPGKTNQGKDMNMGYHSPSVKG